MACKHSPIPVLHGGDLAAACERFGGVTTDWLDLSTGISPHPYPFTAPPATAWTRLPYGAVDRRLRAAAAQCYSAPGPQHVAAAPGSQALIQLLPRLRPPSAVAVVGPTYGEHAACWRAAGHTVTVVPDLFSVGGGCDAVVLGRPNNPDGRIDDRAAVLDLAARLAATGGWLVVDEAFADLDPALGLGPEAGRGGLICLRSFGKFFGLAGLRLGFALAAPALGQQIRDALGPWAVAGPAAEIGAAGLADQKWIEAARVRLTDSAARLDGVLTHAGLKIIGGTALFRLVRTDDATALHLRLAEQRILTRPFAEDHTLIRFGLAGADADFARLAAALQP